MPQDSREQAEGLAPRALLNCSPFRRFKQALSTWSESQKQEQELRYLDRKC